MPRPKQRRAAEVRKSARDEKRHEALEKAKLLERMAKRDKKGVTVDFDSLKQVTNDPEEEEKLRAFTVDPDVKAYFVQLNEQLDELSPEDENIELLVKQALTNLQGHEVPLMFDQDTSLVLERLIPLFSLFSLRVFMDRFAGQYVELSMHTIASHVIEQLLLVASEKLEPANSDGTLPSTESLVLSICDELFPQFAQLAKVSYGASVLGTLFAVLSGTQMQNKSKKSQQFRERHNVKRTHKTAVASAATVKPAPRAFQARLEAAIAEITALGPESIRINAMDAVGSTVVTALIHVDASQRVANALLYGLVLGEVEDVEKLDEYVSGMARDASSSNVLEAVLARSSIATLEFLWENVFSKRLQRLCSHAIGNYIVAKFVDSVVGLGDATLFEQTFKAVLNVEGKEDWFDKRRTGILQALLKGQNALETTATQQSGATLVRSIVYADPDTETESTFALCVLSLNRFEFTKKLPRASLVDSPTTQGSVLLQELFKTDCPEIIASFLALSPEEIVSLSHNTASSYAVDAFIDCPYLRPIQKKKFVEKMFGDAFLKLSDNRIGSRIAEHLFASIDLFLKQKLVESVKEKQHSMHSSQFAHFVARKMDIPLYERRRGEWREKMQALAFASKPKTENKKRPQENVSIQQEDEIDDIFNQPPKKVRT